MIRNLRRKQVYCLMSLAVLFTLGLIVCVSCSGTKSDKDRCADSIGLCVDETGTLVKAGKPYHGAGVNYFDAFSRTLMNHGDTSYRYGFETLAKYNIPFVRFMAGGYWPADFDLYLQDKEKYFALMDGVVKAAEQSGIGLIPSLFWYHTAVPDLVKEPRNHWGDPQSKTMDFMRNYVKEIVTRYKDSPAIWGWEFGNEYNLEIDLPNASELRPPIHTNLGTASERSEQDDLTQQMIKTAFVEFAKEVRKYDKQRIIISGNSLSRPSAWNQNHNHIFGQDSKEQFEEILAAENPDPLDVISVHYYLTDEKRFGRTMQTDEMLQLMLGVAAKAKKPLFIGEFGVGDAVQEGGIPDTEHAKERFTGLLQSLEKAQIPLSALWVYDFFGQKDWTVTGDNGRSYQLQALKEWNGRMNANK